MQEKNVIKLEKYIRYHVKVYIDVFSDILVYMDMTQLKYQVKFELCLHEEKK